MKIQEINPNQKSPPELEATCDHCGFQWLPYENKNYVVEPPTEVELDCPKCGKRSKQFWPDEPMRKEILRQRYIEDLPRKLENAKKKIEALEKERDDWKTKFDDKLKENEKFVDALIRLVKKLEEFGIPIDDSDKDFPHFR